MKKISSSPFAEENALFVQRNMFTDAAPVHALFKRSAYLGPTPVPSAGLESFRRTGIDRLVFGNPYGSLPILRLYQEVRSAGFPRLIIERGALPGTVFLDEDGFLADSAAYDASALTTGAGDATSLLELRNRYFSRPALEPQGASVPELSGAGKPCVAFILQDANDTAVQFQRHQNADYQAFLDEAENFAARFASDFDIFFKPHPRQPDVRLRGAKSLASVDIREALEICDAIVTFSSGVGVMARLLERPVHIFGNAFYRNAPGVAAFESADDLAANISDPTPDDRETLKFLNHLSATYSDCRFAGRRKSNPVSRDLMCRFERLKLIIAGKRYDWAINEKWRSTALRAGRRAVENRFFPASRSIKLEI